MSGFVKIQRNRQANSKIALYLCRVEYCSAHVNEPGYSSGNENSDNELGYSSGNENSNDILFYLFSNIKPFPLTFSGESVNVSSYYFSINSI